MNAFNGWYTDLADIYRTEETVVNNINRKSRKLLYKKVPCRIYQSAKHGPTYSEREPKLMSGDTVAFKIGTDVISGDMLEITRDGAVGGKTVTRYFAGDIMPYYEPVGGAFNGLTHMEVGLLSEEVI